jgi:hypothetical protein
MTIHNVISIVDVIYNDFYKKGIYDPSKEEISKKYNCSIERINLKLLQDDLLEKYKLRSCLISHSHYCRIHDVIPSNRELRPATIHLAKVSLLFNDREAEGLYISNGKEDYIYQIYLMNKANTNFGISNSLNEEIEDALNEGHISIENAIKILGKSNPHMPIGHILKLVKNITYNKENDLF